MSQASQGAQWLSGMFAAASVWSLWRRLRSERIGWRVLYCSADEDNVWNWLMPQQTVTDHVSGVIVSADNPPGDLSTSVDTSNSTSAPMTTVSNDEQAAGAVDVDMETSMTTAADVQVHEPQQRDSMASRHVRFDYYKSVAFVSM